MSVYERLIGLLDSCGAEYRLIHHCGVAALGGRLRAQPVRCVLVHNGLRGLVLAVVRDDQQVVLSTRDSYATMETAEELTGCPVGTLVPFSFRPDLALVMDRDLLMAQEILFPAARQDVSIALNTSDYLRFAAPRVARIARTSFAEAA